MRKPTTFLAVFAAAALVFGGVAAAGPDGAGRGHGPSERFSAELDPLNDSGAFGRAILFRTEDAVRVTVTMHGVSPSLPHPQHIHGDLADGDVETCPGPEAAGEDGLLTTAEGIPAYGGILQPLTPFPVANPGGNYRYDHTFPIGEGEGEIDPEVAANLDRLHIVVHGLDLNGDGDYDNQAGLLTGAELTLPVACGPIEPGAGR